ncbi:MAG: Nramp family divalent metal transporter [Planctomycetia bacterium]|nr:Nramp family divalent metal transporter [Planctomycetia bacterium]
MSATHDAPPAKSDFVPPHPGSKIMPRWQGGELPAPPLFRWQNWLAFLGPGLVSGASAIGGGEWLTGPLVTAKYGGALFWLATMSIFGQVIYNMEISRYTLYSGEPIFTGKFRSLPGPLFWMFVYLVLDFGSILPYLATSAATPVAMVYLNMHGETLDPVKHKMLLLYLSYAIFLLTVIPLIFGGKVYNSLKAAMSFKLVFVIGFLIFIAARYSSAATWKDISSGFFKFGTFPVVEAEDLNGNGKFDPGESDWDGDGRAEGVEKRWTNDPKDFVDVDGDGRYDGFRTANIFERWWAGQPFPAMDLSMFAVLGAMAGLAGTGGLTNTNISGYTRDQGWGMGAHVGAIPSAFGGHSVKLSHMGMVFPINKDSIARFQGWYRHVLRDQLVVWMPACFVGLALPSMLSVQFLPRGLEASTWTAAGMTAVGVENAIGPSWGPTFWFLTLFCGFIILALSNTTTADGYFRRWVDVVWTGLPALRNWDPRRAGQIYFGFLCVYVGGGLIMLTVVKGDKILPIATTIYNCALGFSCFHVLYLNLALLPRELRPTWKVRIMMVLAGVFFMCVSTAQVVGMIADNKYKAAATPEARAEYKSQHPQ